MTNTTLLSNMINPEVMADMISAELPTSLQFAPLAVIGTALSGRPGNTITMPKFDFIGSAEEVGEGQAIPVSKLTTTSIQVTIKKVGKGVTITDEAKLSGYGNPVEEAKEQLKMSIALKIDNDCIDELEKIQAPFIYGTGSEVLTTSVVASAKVLFGEKINEEAVLFVNPKQYSELLKDPNFVGLKDLGGKPVLMSGVVGEVYGCQVAVTSKLPISEGKVSNFIVKAGALGIETKRMPLIETARDIDSKLDKINID
ncbi:MAG: N4-gp56 family major capsid protein, partial [Cetobacterium sp.]